ncbi:methionyl-tRNA formyltransferase [Ulvibacter antarcticus]|uniref:Methionyl-tRNA formyltransferase n=1 Tax=Ulvibacter antarcticus TaxID=442714 RepID=A0A3L9YVQ3_9FLAO|nr:methionyl-tRNA formyltransferase [Ulvibacter antarcticus]RMA64593.1 methionyl-tRNA formyltransferase [Ulvibacter antarcticus]
MRDLRIVFMGTPEFAVGVLQKLIEEKKNIVAVITAPDRPAGRGRKLSSSAVKEYAVSQDIPVLQPTNLKSDAFLEELRSFNANLQIIVAFRMLPKVVWSMPEYGTFNLHASLLPQYRGAAPINWAIINRESQTGVTTFFIDEKIDTGEIILKSEVPIKDTENVGSLHDSLMEIGSELVVETVTYIENGDVKTIAQPKSDILKEAPKLTSENTRIDWTKSGLEIDALIRGLSPYPVAWCELTNNEEILKVKIYAATFEEEEHILAIGFIEAGKKEMKVAVKDGYLNITEIQLPGKRKMEISALLNGYSFSEEAKLM